MLEGKVEKLNVMSMSPPETGSLTIEVVERKEV